MRFLRGRSLHLGRRTHRCMFVMERRRVSDRPAGPLRTLSSALRSIGRRGDLPTHKHFPAYSRAAPVLWIAAPSCAISHAYIRPQGHRCVKDCMIGDRKRPPTRPSDHPNQGQRSRRAATSRCRSGSSRSSRGVGRGHLGSNSLARSGERARRPTSLGHQSGE